MNFLLHRGNEFKMEIIHLEIYSLFILRTMLKFRTESFIL